MIRVIHAVSVMNRAGQETLLMNVYRKLDRQKVQFDFQCSVPGVGDFDEEIHELGGNIYYLGENKIRIPFVRYAGDILLQYRFFNHHREYDVYHIHTYHAFNAWLLIVGAKLGGVKNVILHSHNSSGMHPALHKIFRKLLAFMKIGRYACSEMAAEWMYGKKAVEKQKVTIIKNGVEADDFMFSEEDRDRARTELGIDDKVVVGHIGRFNIQKNHEFLLEIFSEYRKIQSNSVLLLTGTGELEEKIRDQAKRLNLQESVKFLGVRTDVRELLFAMDVFLFPSLYEGLSVVAVEAQATGVPILAADTLSMETKITGCLHFMSLEEPAEAWANRLQQLAGIKHADTIKEIKESGYDISETVDLMTEKYLECGR